MNREELEALRLSIPKAAPAPAVEPAAPVAPDVQHTVVAPWAPVGLGWAAQACNIVSTTRAVPPVLDHQRIIEVLGAQGVAASAVLGSDVGPTVTTYAVRLADGARVSAVGRRAGDIAFGLGLPAVRVLDYLPGKPGAIGLEIANSFRGKVPFACVLAAAGPHVTAGHLACALGADSTGRPVILDLDTCPHLLLAGKSGSGKSVAVHTILASIAALTAPEDVRVVVADPKRVDFQCWNGLPHMGGQPALIDPMAIASAMTGLAAHMDNRLNAIGRRGCTGIASYNQDVGPEERMPRIVVVIDEYGDLMGRGKGAADAVTSAIIRLAQMGRAAGIHLVLATQKPLAEVVHPLIKANTSKIACSVETGRDSLVILDALGAEDLGGAGDALVKDSGGDLTRVQVAWVSPADIRAIKAGRV